MRACPVSAALLLVFVTLLAKTSGEDIYWEGEDDKANEFLEVNEDSGIGASLRRLKRQFEYTNYLTPDSEGNTEEPYTDDQDENEFGSGFEQEEDIGGPENTGIDEDNGIDGEDENNNEVGSSTEPDQTEKTVLVTFVVMEPYKPDYSNRDSASYRNFSTSLSDAVNELFRELPGTHKTSLLRIQSRATEELSCKVTLDITSTGYDDMENLIKILRDQIRNRRRLGAVAVDDADFNYKIHDAGSNSALDACANDPNCEVDWPRTDCYEGSDNPNCQPDVNGGANENRGDVATDRVCLSNYVCKETTYYICIEQRCDGAVDCPLKDDEENCDFITTLAPTPAPAPAPAPECPPGEMLCDVTRCVTLAQQCDGRQDCNDGADEAGCPESCGVDDFRCNDGKCIESMKQCDSVVDCNDGEDERGCATTPCPNNNFTCPPESSVRCANRCDGNSECDGREDEEDCDECRFTCNDRCLTASQVCDGVSDCSDNSDELYCDCNTSVDFRCQNGECINKNLRCNSVSECADGSDEFDCSNTVIPQPRCSEIQFECRNQVCIEIQFRCDGHEDCYDKSDEENCENYTVTYPPSRPQTPIDLSPITNAPPQTQPPYEYSTVTNPPPVPQPPYGYPTTSPPWEPQPPYGSFGGAVPYPPVRRPYEGCGRDQWWCENGPCIDARRRCDGHLDCPHDSSDELDCPPGSPAALNLTIYPKEQTVRYGGDVVFVCRDEGPNHARVHWVRDGQPMKADGIQNNGRLELNKVTSQDSGVYICQATQFLGTTPQAEERAILHVERNKFASLREYASCRPDEATCNNKQCIPKHSVCDRKIDCADGSDEDSCPDNGRCEPNQFQCANRKCVLKTWLCDSQDDCGDKSDEESCHTQYPPQPGQCLTAEYKCSSGGQCIPKSFHCDNHPDCGDTSDEIGCDNVHISSPPKPSFVRLNPGEVLILVCEAVGVPTPLISWRWNWDHVPPICTSTSVDGVGTLTCVNMQPEHSGAYSCEAINNRGTTFATPDSIVYVNKTDPCPEGYFNSEARSQSDCIRCFCFGESNQCRSADLFTFNMPTPLGEGGTRLVGVRQTYNREVVIDKQSVTNDYFYQPLRNGATVTLAPISSWSRNPSVHPYLTLPESYNDNQLNSYGGRIKYRLAPHSLLYVADNFIPDIIIKGKYQSLVHYHRGENAREIEISARLTPGDWQRSGPEGLSPASREDIMMALDNIEMILLRADHNNGGVNITDFVMESAHNLNAGLGVASLVEECTCPAGYEGRSCQKCAAGFVRESSGPWLGNCVKRRECPPGTYSDPNNEFDCKPCPCPLTNSRNQFARTCALGPAGRVICDCLPGYEGDDCSYCSSTHVGNPLIPGDSCKPRQAHNCDSLGTSTVRSLDECVCKDNVQGRYCDQCKNGSFYLSNDFRHGCALCFCSGVSQQCTSSSLRRKTTTVHFNVPSIVDQVKVYKSSPFGSAGIIRYSAPDQTNNRVQISQGEVYMDSLERSEPAIYYWSLPSAFAGDKVTTYGGDLRYALRHIPSPGQNSRNNAADVQLVSENRLTFHYFGNFVPGNDGFLNATVKFLEEGWRRSDGKEVNREHFLLALADVKTILVKATYTTGTSLASLVSASIETAEPYGDGPLALHVEQCICPPGYEGTSCEDCARGYTRTSSGLYLARCEPCECNGNSNMCNPETGECFDCRNNTAGPNCELCKDGYERDDYSNCVRSSTSTPGYCNCDPRGEDGPCLGYCRCKQNVEGQYCDLCRPGTFGLSAANPLGCTSCFCSGVTNDCHEASHFARIPIPAPIFGEKHGGYTLTDLRAEQVIGDEFIPAPDQSQLTYSFPFPPQEELYWSLPEFPGNRVLSYGGTLSLEQEFRSNDDDSSTPDKDVVLVGDELSLFWSNPNTIRSGVAFGYQVPLTEANWYVLNRGSPATRQEFMSVLKNLRRVLVRATLVPNLISTSIADVSMDTAAESTDPNLPAATGVEVCMCPAGYSGTSCEICSAGYYKDQNGYCNRCNCNGHDCQLDVSNEVVCNCRPPYTGPDCSAIGNEINPHVTRPPPPRSTVSVRITSQSLMIREVGSSVNFTCQAQSLVTPKRLNVTWRKENGYLPQDRTQVDERRGILFITNLQVSDSGVYICQSQDGIFTEQATATLKVPGNEMTLPTVAITPAVQDYYEDDRIQLVCNTSGNPAPSVSWQRGSNQALPQTAVIYDALFVIERAQVEDSGEYRCIARNTAGAVDRTARVTVRPRPSRPLREKLVVSPPASTVYEGQSTRIVCTGTPNVPAGTIQWIRQDGAEFLPNVQSDNGVLYISNAVPENWGIYVCQAQSYEIQPVPVVLTVISVNTPSPEQATNITVSTERLTIPTGGTGTVDCNPQGYPLPLIRWTKYSGEFGGGTSQRDNTLIISNAQDSDRGFYNCEGIVDEQPVVNIYVLVEIERREPPRVEIWPQFENIVALGSQYDLQCRVTGGVPDPDVTWDRAGGRSLSSDAQIQKNNVLRFDRADVNDEGEYTCTATNSAGRASASAVIKVVSIPEITITPNDFVETVQGDSIRIECRSQGYPDPQVSILDRNDNVVVAAAPRVVVLSFPAVRVEDEGDYKCVATSLAGTVQKMFAIRVDRGDGGFGTEGSADGEINPEEEPVYQPPYEPYNPPSSNLAVEGRETRLVCNTSSDYEVRWSRSDRQPLQYNARQIGSDLVIINPGKNDSGQYECTLINPYTQEVKQAVYTWLQVIAPPRITLRPPTQVVQPGQSPTVECIVEGDDVEVTWSSRNRNPSSRVEMRGPILRFRQIEIEDAGEYICLARNLVANATAIAEVKVSEDSDRTTWESHDNEQFAHVGAAVHLSCNVTQRNLRIHWTKDGRGLPSSVTLKRDGSLFIRLAQRSDSGRYVCIISDAYGRKSSNYINLHIEGPRVESKALVAIEQPRRVFRVGDRVEVLCRAAARDVQVTWEKNGTKEYVDSRVYGDGALLMISGVEHSDTGVYRCTGRGSFGHISYDDFILEVAPDSSGPSYPINESEQMYKARLGDEVDLPCIHNLEEPVSIEWKREYSQLPPDVRPNESILRLRGVTEADAGTYVCRVSNSRTAIETRAVLRVTGVVPRFSGNGYIALDPLRDAYEQFEIEISFKPTDDNGLILFNSQNPDGSGDFLALQLISGVPTFTVDTGSGPVVITGDRPLQLNSWHTIRLSKTDVKVTMDVDNTGPFSDESMARNHIFEIPQPLYVGGVPDYNLLPPQLQVASGFVGCVSMLILGRDDQNLMSSNLQISNVEECDTCTPNQCLNNGVCQEARIEHGYVCHCAAGFAGRDCHRTGEACRPGLCGPGRCADTLDGYKCNCPLTYTGKNCDVKQSIEYPAFTGSAYLAVKAPSTSRFFRMSMKIKAAVPVVDGIIMYCARSNKGNEGFTSLVVHDGRLEFRYDFGDDSVPVVLISNKMLPANEWTDVAISRVGHNVFMTIGLVNKYEAHLASPKEMVFDTPLFVGGVDDSIKLNSNIGVTGGFSGCIKDVQLNKISLDLVNSSIQSANVQECVNNDRGDIPEVESVCSQCRNGGYCLSGEATSCTCPSGYTGLYCESRSQPREPASASPADPCALRPCNSGICRLDRSSQMNYTCDCPLGFAGTSCHIPLPLGTTVGFNGNGYLELPAYNLRYDDLESQPALFAMAFETSEDGVLLYQREARVAPDNNSDFFLLRVERGIVVLEWNLGSGVASISIDDITVTDGYRHQVIVQLFADHHVELSVDGETRKKMSFGISNIMNADSNIYIGGIPDHLNYLKNYPGLKGCIEAVEFMDTSRAVKLGENAVAGKNTQRCRN